MVKKPNLLRAILNNFPPGLAKWMANSTLVTVVSWLQVDLSFISQMSIFHYLLRIICSTNWYKKYQLDCPIRSPYICENDVLVRETEFDLLGSLDTVKCMRVVRYCSTIPYHIIFCVAHFFGMIVLS